MQKKLTDEARRLLLEVVDLSVTFPARSQDRRCLESGNWQAKTSPKHAAEGGAHTIKAEQNARLALLASDYAPLCDLLTVCITALRSN